MAIQLLHFAGTFVLSVALGLYLTPIVREGAIKYGVLDQPDGALKQHKTPTPYLGGIAVYLTFLVTLGIVFDFSEELLGLLLGGTMVAMLGLFDDLRVIPPGLKLLGQLLAAWILIKSGITIQLVWLPPWAAMVLTVFWIIGITNAFNILDVSDGLAGGVAAVAGLALFIVATLQGDALIATATLALCGSLVAFLWFNQPPAKIYLGDTGSLFIGFMLASLSMIGDYTQTNVLGALAPVFILGVPIFETVLVTIARLAKGIPPVHGSPDHLAIRLKAVGWSAGRVALFGCALGVVSATAGLALVLTDADAAITSVGAIVFVGLLATLLRLPTAKAS